MHLFSSSINNHKQVYVNTDVVTDSNIVMHISCVHVYFIRSNDENTRFVMCQKNSINSNIRSNVGKD